MASHARVSFHGGIGAIGGTKVAVQEGDYRVLFDFGLEYAPGAGFWSGGIQPRPGPARLRDLAALGDLPPLDGLYPPGPSAALGLRPGGDGKTQVFISHLHLDHMALVDTLDGTVPVWMHEETLRLFRAVAATGEPPAVPEGARAFRPGDAIRVGPMVVTPLPVDHDVPGATGLLIRTSAGAVAYSGDLRLHGSHPELTQAFTVAAREAGTRILLLEGTRLSNGSSAGGTGLSEPEVGGAVAEHLKAACGLGLISLYPRNTARIAAVAAAAQSAGRRLLLSPQSAYIYLAMGGTPDSVGVYRRAADAYRMGQGQASAWLEHLFAQVVTIGAEEVAGIQERYLIQLLPGDLPELVDLRPRLGSVFIHSNGEPLGRFDPFHRPVRAWLSRFGIPEVSARCSGHATADDLNAMAAAVAPAVLMPIHSLSPERLEVPNCARVLPVHGAAYDVATGERLS